MNDLTPFAGKESLPSLIDHAAQMLTSARNSAEVLEARDAARVAYDAAKSTGRMARAKQAHDDVISAVYRAQADALLIEARAKAKLADEYDAAQDRDEVFGAHNGARKRVGDDNAIAAAAEIGLRRDEIHEARKIRDAEQASPGIAARALDAMVERGEEPTKAALRREMNQAPQPAKVMDPKALWLWGRLRDFDRNGILAADASGLLGEMTEPMRQDVRAALPAVLTFLKELEAEA